MNITHGSVNDLDWNRTSRGAYVLVFRCSLKSRPEAFFVVGRAEVDLPEDMPEIDEVSVTLWRGNPLDPTPEAWRARFRLDLISEEPSAAPLRERMRRWLEVAAIGLFWPIARLVTLVLIWREPPRLGPVLAWWHAIAADPVGHIWGTGSGPCWASSATPEAALAEATTGAAVNEVTTMNEPTAIILLLAFSAAVLLSAGLGWLCHHLFRASCRRCLWCERLYDDAGLTPPDDDPYVCGHGLCPDCAAQSRHDHPTFEPHPEAR